LAELLQTDAALLFLVAFANSSRMWNRATRARPFFFEHGELENTHASLKGVGVTHDPFVVSYVYNFTPWVPIELYFSRYSHTLV
jgi:hypothetical protein